MVTSAEWDRVVAALTARGFLPGDIEWAEACAPPTDADEFAREIVFVICNSGMKNTVARGIYNRVRGALESGASAATVFGHKGKCGAIDTIWRGRAPLFIAYGFVSDKVAWLGALPWIGDITKFHAARNFGVDCVKPDVHLQRLADHHGVTPTALCEPLARAYGLRIGTVDTILWRACAVGVIDSRTGEFRG